MNKIDSVIKFQSCECGSQAFGIVDNKNKSIEKVVCLKCGITYANTSTKNEEPKTETKKEKAIEVDKDIKNKKETFTDRLNQIRGTFV